MGLDPLLVAGQQFSFSTLMLLVGSLTCKTVSRMTYTVLVETLNPTHSLTLCDFALLDLGWPLWYVTYVHTSVVSWQVLCLSDLFGESNAVFIKILRQTKSQYCPHETLLPSWIFMSVSIALIIIRLSLIFLNHSWNHLTDKSKAQFLLLAYISSKNMA